MFLQFISQESSSYAILQDLSQAYSKSELDTQLAKEKPMTKKLRN